MGYHIRTIPRGIIGEVSKIEEELAELRDALTQGNTLMAMHELSDLVGSIELFLQRRYPHLTLDDLITMKNATRSAFCDGTRSSPPRPRITTDYLKDNHRMIHFFGLGFIQIKLDDHDRVHIYHPELPAFVEEPHDHRYDFHSTVLVGTLTNIFYEFVSCEPTATRDYLAETSCDPENTADTTPIPVRLVRKKTITTHAGASYYVGFDQFHTVHPTGMCATYLQRSPICKDYARTIRREGAPPVCPFSKTIAEDHLWEYVDRVLSS